MKRNILGSTCQNARRDTKHSAQPSGDRASVSVPTLESSVVMRPIRSSLGRMLRDLKMPSRRMLTRQSARGRPVSGVDADELVVIYWAGGSL